MIVRFKSDNMSYGEVGTPVYIDNQIYHIGDILNVKINTGKIVNCMVVIPEWNPIPTLMGIGQLGFNEEIISTSPYSVLKIGDEHRDCLFISES